MSPWRLSPPGAARSSSLPNDEYGARRPSGPIAATATEPGYAAGYSTRPMPPLPAAQTTVVPLPRAYAIAFSITAERPPPPRDRLITFAP